MTALHLLHRYKSYTSIKWLHEFIFVLKQEIIVCGKKNVWLTVTVSRLSVDTFCDCFDIRMTWDKTDWKVIGLWSTNNRFLVDRQPNCLLTQSQYFHNGYQLHFNHRTWVQIAGIRVELSSKMIESVFGWQIVSKYTLTHPVHNPVITIYWHQFFVCAVEKKSFDMGCKVYPSIGTPYNVVRCAHINIWYDMCFNIIISLF